MATESYQQMADCLYSDANWWELSVELQKYMLLMNANMQRLLYYHGFDVAVLNLETFSAVSKLATKYLILTGKKKRFNSFSVDKNSRFIFYDV